MTKKDILALMHNIYNSFKFINVDFWLQKVNKMEETHEKVFSTKK